MNDRSTALRLIAVALAGYGLYIAAYVPAMLVGQPVPLLLIGFVLKVACALAAAVGVWRGRPWSAVSVVLLGASIAATRLIDGRGFRVSGLRRARAATGGTAQR